MTTKYDILKHYKENNQFHRIRDTWLNLGGAVATRETRTFVKDMIYRLDLTPANSGDPFPAFHQALILCESSLYSTSPLNWNNVTIEDSDQGFFCFNQGIITPHFRLLLTADEFNTITEPHDASFVPYTEIDTSDIIIPDHEVELILLEVGVPFITLEELEFPKNKILNLMIKPAMQEYFKWFPIIKPQVINQSASLAYGAVGRVEMPPDAYGAVRVMSLQGVSTGASGPGNPLHFYASEILWQGAGTYQPGSRSIRRPGYANLDSFGVGSLDRAARQGIINYASRIHYRIVKEGQKKYLEYHTNKLGLIEIHWAFASNNWADIDYHQQQNVRDLATAKVMIALGRLRSQVKSDIPGSIDYSSFLNRGKELEEKVLSLWNQMGIYVVSRGH